MAKENLFPTFDKWTIYNGTGTEVTDSLVVSEDGYSCSFTVTNESSYIRYRLSDDDIKELRGHKLILHLDNFSSSDNQPFLRIRLYSDVDNDIYESINLRYQDDGELKELSSFPLDYEFTIPADCVRLDIRFLHYYASEGIDPPAVITISNVSLIDTYTENLTSLNFHKVLEENLPTSVTPGSQHIYFTTDGTTIKQYISTNEGYLIPVGGEASSGVVSWNDLTDKPFGETVSKIDIIPCTDYVFIYDYAWTYMGMLTDTASLSNGSSIKATFDGVEYDNTLTDIGGMLAFGNLDKAFGEGDSGEPYYGVLLPGENAWMLYTFDDEPTDASATITHSFGMSAVASVTKKIDTKFLYRPDWTINDPTSFSSIKGRPFGEVKAGQLVYSSVHMPFASYSGPNGSTIAMATTNGAVDIRSCVIEGASYLVTLNGVEYTVTASSTSLGNVDSGETPFEIKKEGTVYWTISSEDVINGNTSAEITVKFLMDKDNYGYAYLPIPEEYLPSSIGSGGSTGPVSWNDLTDKPFGMTTKTLMTWDGDITGLPSFDMEGTNVYKISDTPVTMEELIGAKATIVTSNGTSQTVIQESDLEPVLPTVIVISSFIFSVLEDTALAADLTISKGLWHVDPSLTGFYASSAVGNAVIPLNIKYIPQELYTEIDNRIDSYINEALGGEY